MNFNKILWNPKYIQIDYINEIYNIKFEFTTELNKNFIFYLFDKQMNLKYYKDGGLTTKKVLEINIKIEKEDEYFCQISTPDQTFTSNLFWIYLNKSTFAKNYF